jgi:hypothetical protein
VPVSVAERDFAIQAVAEGRGFCLGGIALRQRATGSRLRCAPADRARSDQGYA